MCLYRYPDLSLPLLIQVTVKTMWVTVKVLTLSVIIIIIINICTVMSIFQKKICSRPGLFPLNSIQGLRVFKPFSKIIHVVFKGMQLTYELRCEKKVCRPFPQFYELRSARFFSTLKCLNLFQQGIPMSQCSPQGFKIGWPTLP